MKVETTAERNKSRKNVERQSWIEKIPTKGWLLLSLTVAVIFWSILSVIPSTARSFPNIIYVVESMVE